MIWVSFRKELKRVEYFLLSNILWVHKGAIILIYFRVRFLRIALQLFCSFPSPVMGKKLSKTATFVGYFLLKELMKKHYTILLYSSMHRGNPWGGEGSIVRWWKSFCPEPERWTVELRTSTHRLWFRLAPQLQGHGPVASCSRFWYWYHLQSFTVTGPRWPWAS